MNEPISETDQIAVQDAVYNVLEKLLINIKEELQEEFFSPEYEKIFYSALKFHISKEIINLYCNVEEKINE